MGMGIRALVLTLMRNTVLVIPILLVMSHYYGVRGAFTAQPISDVVGVFITAAMLLQVYRRYPIGGRSRQRS